MQEGEAGNGFEFLAMHRAMLRMMVTKFPKHKSLFKGWTKVPTNPRDKTSPLPNGSYEEFDEDMLVAVDKLTNHLDDFESDDDLGRYVETKSRPVPGDPRRRTDDPSAGIHNFLHVRFMDPSSKVDIGNPQVNLKNKMFWRLHGWLDSRWTAYRKLKGLSESEPKYKEAIAKASEALVHKHGIKGVTSPPPESLVNFFASEAASENP